MNTFQYMTNQLTRNLYSPNNYTLRRGWIPNVSGQLIQTLNRCYSVPADRIVLSFQFKGRHCKQTVHLTSNIKLDVYTWSLYCVLLCMLIFYLFFFQIDYKHQYLHIKIASLATKKILHHRRVWFVGSGCWVLALGLRAWNVGNSI